MKREKTKISAKEFFKNLFRRRPKEKRNKFTPITVAMLVLLILYSLMFIFLLIWAVSTSFKINQYVFDYDPYRIFPRYNWYKSLSGTQAANFTAVSVQQAAKEGSLAFYTYRNMFNLFSVKVASTAGKASRTVYMEEMYLYSFLYSGGSAIVNTVVPCIVAYCCARFNFRFSKIVHTLVIVVMIIPIVGSLPSEIRMASSLGIYDTVWGVWIMKANFLGLYFLVFYDIFKALPASYIEAAKIDGANNLQVLLRIALPLVKNTFFTVLLIKFITFWNDYQTPAVFMGSYPTVALTLNRLMNSSMNIPNSTFVPTHLPAKMATVVMAATPIFILYVVFQKRLLGNLTMGGIKG